jgi:vancomycin permeability regulator SanA
MRRKLLILVSAAVLLFLGSAGLLVWGGVTDHPGQADVALVLGNQVNPDGSPSPRLKARLDTAAEWYRRGYFPILLVSGATGREGVPEGTAMKNYLVASGIPEASVLVDDQGVDTQASAKNTATLLRERGWKSVFVVTQYFHIPRTKLALSKFGISTIHHAHPRYFEARDLYSIAREIPACAKYLMLPRKDASEAE